MQDSGLGSFKQFLDSSVSVQLPGFCSSGCAGQAVAPTRLALRVNVRADVLKQSCTLGVGFQGSIL